MPPPPPGMMGMPPPPERLPGCLLLRPDDGDASPGMYGLAPPPMGVAPMGMPLAADGHADGAAAADGRHGGRADGRHGGRADGGIPRGHGAHGHGRAAAGHASAAAAAEVGALAIRVPRSGNRWREIVLSSFVTHKRKAARRTNALASPRKLSLVALANLLRVPALLSACRRSVSLVLTPLRRPGVASARRGRSAAVPSPRLPRPVALVVLVVVPPALAVRVAALVVAVRAAVRVPWVVRPGGASPGSSSLNIQMPRRAR